MGLQLLWSFGLACLDIYALKMRKDLHNPILVSLFVVGDWVSYIFRLIRFVVWYVSLEFTDIWIRPGIMNWLYSLFVPQWPLYFDFVMVKKLIHSTNKLEEHLFQSHFVLLVNCLQALSRSPHFSINPHLFSFLSVSTNYFSPLIQVLHYHWLKVVKEARRHQE